MATEGFKKLIERAIADEEFATLLTSDPETAIADFKLSKEERDVVVSKDAKKAESLGVDRRLTRAMAS